MNTIQFQLCPDKNLPMFSRLEWTVVDVSFRDVLEQGIHPWAGDGQHHDIAEAFLVHLNKACHQPARLQEHQFLYNINIDASYSWSRVTRFERLLEGIQSNVLFCDSDLDYASLSKIAYTSLAEQWCNELALRLARRAHPSFQKLRSFLKSKSKTVKLRGETDLDKYDWSSILSLDDFANYDRLVLDVAIQPLNFRNTSFLDAVTDDKQRLCLRPAMNHVTLEQPATPKQRMNVRWQGERQGGHWRLRPDIGLSEEVRNAAKDFAARWRQDTGRICFNVSTEKLIEMVDSETVSVKFPGLRYTREPYSPDATGKVRKSRVSLYTLIAMPQKKWSGEQLKLVLRQHGASTTGVKKVLIEKIAKLTASEYDTYEPMLNRFFSENRFVHVSSEVRIGGKFPVPDMDETLKELILAVYALRHLRGNVVVDTTYLNDSCSVPDLALALINGRITLEGGFMQVA